MAASLATVTMDMLKQAQMCAFDAPLQTLEITEGLGDKDDVIRLTAVSKGWCHYSRALAYETLKGTKNMALEIELSLKFIQTALNERLPVSSETVVWLDGTAAVLKALQNGGSVNEERKMWSLWHLQINLSRQAHHLICRSHICFA